MELLSFYLDAPNNVLPACEQNQSRANLSCPSPARNKLFAGLHCPFSSRHPPSTIYHPPSVFFIYFCFLQPLRCSSLCALSGLIKGDYLGQRRICQRPLCISQLTCLLGYIEQLGHQILVVGRALGQKEGAPVRVGEQADVDQDFVAEHIDVQLVGHVANQFHEQLALVQVHQMPSTLGNRRCRRVGEAPGRLLERQWRGHMQ